MVKLNETQNELLRVSKEKGFLTDDDFKLRYTSPITIKANTERFILMKIIDKKDDEGKYKYLGEQDE
jgi:hypothetical protein